MSGSSMDGVDLACCEFALQQDVWSYQIVVAETLPYPEELLRKLQLACTWTMEEIKALDRELGEFYAELLNEFHLRVEWIPDLIASHGHTILHEPEKGVTFQAGQGEIMAGNTGIAVVNDFRSEDVAQGGQGAPLVPVGDRLLFGNYDACLNLGGFANISYEDERGQRIAYDLCPANMALNWIAALEGMAFDKGGEMARQGSVNSQLLKELNQLEYYSCTPPKSLGREWFLEYMLPLLERKNLSTRDLMATTVEHVAIQITKSINSYGIKTILVTGGGALNHSLIERFNYHSSAHFEIPDMQLIQFKEALVFAFLGVLRIRGEINCLSSVTGGKKDLSSGTIHRSNS